MKKIRIMAVMLAAAVLSSCNFNTLLDEIQEKISTLTARYTQKNVADGGIKIHSFDNGIKLSALGIKKPDGSEIESLDFNGPDSDGILGCEDLPLDFFKISDSSRSIGPGDKKYVGKWEAFIPLPSGFKRIFLRIKNASACSLQLEFKSDEPIKTHTETIIKADVMEENGIYKFSKIDTKASRGYKSSLKRLAAYLSDKNGILSATFPIDGQNKEMEIFKFNKNENGVKTYSGYGKFDSKMTLEIGGGKGTLTIPKGTELPREF